MISWASVKDFSARSRCRWRDDKAFRDATNGCEAERDCTKRERRQDRVSLHKLADVIDRPVTMCQDKRTFKVSIQIVSEVFG